MKDRVEDKRKWKEREEGSDVGHKEECGIGHNEGRKEWQDKKGKQGRKRKQWSIQGIKEGRTEKTKGRKQEKRKKGNVDKGLGNEVRRNTNHFPYIYFPYLFKHSNVILDCVFNSDYEFDFHLKWEPGLLFKIPFMKCSFSHYYLDNQCCDV